MNKMLRTAFVSLLIFVSFSSCSTSILRKSIFRRQSDPQYCNAIEGFDCKCSYYRVTCTNDRDLSSPINIIPNEKGKYQSVELVVTAQRDVQVNDRTFEPVKELYKSDGDNLEFRVKFEKFTSLHLASPGIFNRVFPQNLSPNSKKHLALEIYNPEVPPQDDNQLFQNLNVDSLELYALYPFHGTFQQLFNGANIQYLRLSGGDIRSDMSQPFTGNIARLELAKQANSLSVQNFPVYPAHELIINAFYITEFNNENPPNYSNLGELRIHSPDRIPADAFRQFPNIHTLSISTDKDIDPQALNGLQNLEKLTIKDTKPSIDVLNSVPTVKEFETSLEKLDEKSQCQLLDKLANGQVFVQATPNGRECTCVSAYLDTAMSRTPCDAQNCDQSSCAAIKNNYDPSSRTFTTPPTIRRSDGSDAARAREAKVYATPFQVSRQDQEKLQQAIPSQSTSGSNDQGQRPQTQNQDEQDQRRPDVTRNPDEPSGSDGSRDEQDGNRNDEESTTTVHGDTNRSEGEANENEVVNQSNRNPDGNAGGEETGATETATSSPAKKGMSWLPIIIIAASIVGLLLIGLIYLLVRKRRANKGYAPPATGETPATRA